MAIFAINAGDTFFDSYRAFPLSLRDLESEWALAERAISKHEDGWRAKPSASPLASEGTSAPLKALPVLKPAQWPTAVLPEAAPGMFRVALDIGHTIRSGGAVSASGVMEYRFNKDAVKNDRIAAREVATGGADCCRSVWQLDKFVGEGIEGECCWRATVSCSASRQCE